MLLYLFDNRRAKFILMMISMKIFIPFQFSYLFSNHLGWWFQRTNVSSQWFRWWWWWFAAHDDWQIEYDTQSLAIESNQKLVLKKKIKRNRPFHRRVLSPHHSHTHSSHQILKKETDYVIRKWNTHTIQNIIHKYQSVERLSFRKFLNIHATKWHHKWSKHLPNRKCEPIYSEWMNDDCFTQIQHHFQQGVCLSVWSLSNCWIYSWPLNTIRQHNKFPTAIHRLPLNLCPANQLNHTHHRHFFPLFNCNARHKQCYWDNYYLR